MKQIALAILAIFMFENENLRGQTALEKGTVSYVSSQNVYVKYDATTGINIGDTLFLKNGENLTPALRVSNKSSTSAVCSRLVAGAVFKSGDEIFARVPERKKKQDEPKDEPKKEETEKEIEHGKTPEQQAKEEDGGSKPLPKIKAKQRLRARLSAASYSNFYNDTERHRMRYAFTLQGNNIKNSRFSTDNYITFRHTLGDTAAFKNLNDALKIYSLSVKYEFRGNAGSIAIGRKINQRMASVGAIDGLQFEKNFTRKFGYGAVLGSRPNLSDYSFNFNLLEGGVFVGYSSNDKNRLVQSTLGFLEQRNGGAVDRRYAYAQHSGDLTQNLNIFGSAEMDLYQKVDDEVKNKAQLTNLFVSARYKFSQKLSATLSFDSRKNIIFYESYKTYIDQLIENETRQGLRAGLNFRPRKRITFGANASWRFQDALFFKKTENAGGSNEVKNLNAYLNFNRIPGIKANLSLSTNFLQTGYLNSKMFGARLNKDFWKGKINAEAYYRNLTYDYLTSDYRSQQHVAGGSLSVILTKKLSLFLFSEKTFSDRQDDFLMFNTKLMQRF